MVVGVGKRVKKKGVFESTQEHVDVGVGGVHADWSQRSDMETTFNERRDCLRTFSSACVGRLC